MTEHAEHISHVPNCVLVNGKNHIWKASDISVHRRRDSSVLIFVYGSLKQGYDLHHLLESQPSLGEATTKPIYRLFDLGSYPGLVEWPDGLAIRGEVYQVDAECLKLLDEAEGVAEGYYARRSVALELPFGIQDVHAWFWLLPVTGRRDCGRCWP